MRIANMNTTVKPHHIPRPPKPPPPPPANTNATPHSQLQESRNLLFSYTCMLADGKPPTPHSFPSLLKACTSLARPSLGLNLHQHAIAHGYAPDDFIASSLISMYSKFRDLDSARKVFDGMPTRNVVPWSALISGYSQLGDVGMASAMWEQMCREGVEPNSITILALLSGVSELDHLQCLHSIVIRSGFDEDLTVANSMLNLYSSCGRVELSWRLFDSMPRRDIISWNCMLSGYARNRNLRESIELFEEMRLSVLKPDHQTFLSLVSAITNSGGGVSYELCEPVHAQVITSGFEQDSHIETTLMTMYLRSRRNVNYAAVIFRRTLHKDIVSWTAMISGLVQNDRADEALSVFKRMLGLGMSPSTATIASALAACAHLDSFKLGTSIHGYIIRQEMKVDLAAENSLISMYAKCGHLKLCQYVFDRMQDRDVVSWNAVVSGYAQNGDLNGAIFLFNRMIFASQKPDSVTVISLLQACASLGTLHHGKFLHSFVIRNELRSSISIETSLVDMYSKCGKLESAQRCFNAMAEHDLVSWSAIIAGYGSHGKGEIALRLYSDYLRSGREPNHVMFLSVLSACSHTGLVSDGLSLFRSMVEDFKMVPSLEHYSCVIDLLGKAGLVEEALGFINKMSPDPSADILGILLDACRVHRNAAVGEEIAGEIIKLKPESAGNYVQLAHSYAAMSRWECMGEARMRMRSMGLRKTPGWSFVELNGTVTTFFVDHTSHPQYEEMIQLLKFFDNEVRNRNSTTINLS